MKRNKNDIFYLLILLTFRGVLDWSYNILGKVQFDVEFDIRLNLLKCIFSYIALVFLAAPTYGSKKLSFLFYRMILLFTIAPLSCVYAWRNENSVFFVLVVLTFFIAEYIVLRTKYISQSVSRIHLRNKQSSKLVCSCSVLLSLITLFLMYGTNGIPSLSTVLLDTVYEVRSNFSVSTYLTYLLFVTSLVLVPFGLADAYTRKKPVLLVFYFLTQIVLFLWTGNKAWLFSLLLFIGIIVILKLKKGFNLFFLGVCAITAVGCLTNQTDIGIGIFSLINRRVLLDPAALKFFYYDYFIVNDHSTIGFAGTLLAPIVNFLHPTGSLPDYAYTISSIYTDSPSNAVTGLYGGDFAHFGVFSFILVPIALVFFSFLVEVSNKRSGSMFTILLFSFLAYFFNDQKIVPYFLDFRGIILIFIVLLYSGASYYKNKIAPTAKYE